MTIIIDVPEEVYNMVMNTSTFGCYRFNTAKAIKNGTSLPQNHGNLKDVDAILDKLLEVGWLDGEAGDELESIFNLFPTIIEAYKPESEDKK